MDPLEQGVWRTIQRLELVRPVERLVLAVSGGPDSLALLHVMCALREHLGAWLCVATLDHMMRPESAEDAAFVCRQAEALGLLCVREQRDVPTYARTHRLSLEEAAREVRYRFLAEVAGAVNATAVATGHTADDQAETVLMHFLRGAGLSGLKGMLPRRPMDIAVREGPPPPVRPDLVRPLLFTPRSDILAYLERRGVTPRFDRSNLDTTFFRNRLRHELLPLLEQYQPNIRRLLARTAETLAVDWDYLQQQTEAAWQALAHCEADHVRFPRQAFLEYHPAIQRGLVRRAVRRLRPLLRDVGWEHVVEAVRLAREGRTGTRATLPGHLFLFVDYDVIVIGEALPTPPWPRLAPNTRLSVPVPGEVRLENGWTLSTRLVERDQLPPDALADTDVWRALLDAEAVHLPLALRTRRRGDRFVPLGMTERVKLSDFLTAQKVPAAVRDTLPLLVDAHDRLLWVPGVRLSQEARVTESTQRVLVVELRPPEGA